MILQLKKKIINYLPYRTKYWFEKLKLFLNSPKIFFSTAQANAVNPQTIVILSFPRSGSSWIGSILGFSEHSRYLREPVTTPYMLGRKNRISVFSSDKCDNWHEYQQLMTQSMFGKATKLDSVFKYPTQWLSSKIVNNYIIKEVNPLVIEHYLASTTKLIYLIRHPYSVIKSYMALNWQATDLFSRKFNKAELDIILANCPSLLTSSFYFQMGYLLGWIEVRSQQKITDKRAQIIKYEDLCQDPINAFSKIFDQHGLVFNDAIKDRITQSLSSTKSSSLGNFSLERKIDEITHIKVKEGEKHNFTTVMTAYLEAIASYNSIYNCQYSGAYQLDSPYIKWINE